MKRFTKKIILFASIFIFSIAAIGFIIFSQSEDFITLKVKFQSCPYNHYSLKAVHISYGFTIPDSNYHSNVDNYEAYDGGCVITDHSPKYKVVCTKCGYVLEDSDSTSFWLRRKNNNTGFEIPLDKIISNAPIVSIFTMGNVTSLFYLQEFSNGKISSESISYESIAPISELTTDLLEYAKTNSLDVNEIDLSKEIYFDYYKSIKSFQAVKTNKIYELALSEDKDINVKRVTLSWQIIN